MNALKEMGLGDKTLSDPRVSPTKRCRFVCFLTPLLDKWTVCESKETAYLILYPYFYFGPILSKSAHLNPS